MDKKIRVVLSDINEDARAMLQETLERSGRFIIAGSTGDGEVALRLIRETKPDVVVLEMALPGLDGLAILRRLEEKDRPAILAMSSCATAHIMAEAGMPSISAAMMMAMTRSTSLEEVEI